MKLKCSVKKLGLITLGLLFLTEVFAFVPLYDCGNQPKRWPNNWYQINANPTGFSGKWWYSLDTARKRLNNNPSNFYMSQQLDNDYSVGVGNGESEIWWCGSSNECSPAIAFTLSKNCGTVVEADVMFYNGIAYEDNMNKINFWGFGGNSRPFETTAIHELGHTAGLGHENNEYNIMGGDYTFIHVNGDSVRSYIGEDGSDGLVWLYGSRNAEDVSVVNYKYKGRSGAYSAHEHTQLYDTSGNILSGSNSTSTCYRNMCETTYDVSAGQTVDFEVTAENSGRNSQTVNISYYLSTNSTITTTDTLLATDSISVSRRDADTIKKRLTIPNNLQTGNYWLGAIIDSSNWLAEVDEVNNATYTAIRIMPPPQAIYVGDRLTLSNSEGSEDHYLLELSAAQAALVNGQLAVTLNGGSGDADLFVKFGSRAARGNADCESYQNTTNESCTLNVENRPGSYYIMVEGYSAYANAILAVNLNGSQPEELRSGDQRVLSGAENSYTHFLVNVPSGYGNRHLVITLTGGNGDADLFVKKGALAYRDAADCESYADTTNETCSMILGNVAATYYISVEGYSAYTGAVLKVDIQ